MNKMSGNGDLFNWEIIGWINFMNQLRQAAKNKFKCSGLNKKEVK